MAVDVLLPARGAAAPGVPVVVLPARRGGPRRSGVAVRCPACARTSVNLVTRPHLDVPFHNDPEIGVVRHVFSEEPIVEEFRAFLDSSDFDGRRLAL